MNTKLGFISNLSETLSLWQKTWKQMLPFALLAVFFGILMLALQQMTLSHASIGNGETPKSHLYMAIALGLVGFIYNCYLIAAAIKCTMDVYQDREVIFQDLNHFAGQNLLRVLGARLLFTLFFLCAALCYIIPVGLVFWLTVDPSTFFTNQAIYMLVLAFPVIVVSLNGFLMLPSLIIKNAKIYESWKVSKTLIYGYRKTVFVHILAMGLLALCASLVLTSVPTGLLYAFKVKSTYIAGFNNVLNFLIQLIVAWIWIVYSVVLYYKLTNIKADSQATEAATADA